MRTTVEPDQQHRDGGVHRQSASGHRPGPVVHVVARRSQLPTDGRLEAGQDVRPGCSATVLLPVENLRALSMRHQLCAKGPEDLSTPTSPCELQPRVGVARILGRVRPVDVIMPRHGRAGECVLGAEAAEAGVASVGVVEAFDGVEQGAANHRSERA
jgi:hypothetical protein